MKEINLRKYYPHYTQDMMVEVHDEVAELLQEFTRAEDARRICTLQGNTAAVLTRLLRWQTARKRGLTPCIMRRSTACWTHMPESWR